ncbi:MAG: hypothetical protein OQL08_05205 [Gammaproteobacteria bacterium]|nr:hypothetical protein [Gammaproteobacteria bacterium]
MNIFILNSGRCGSTTFIRACSHIRNYSALHESRCGLIGPQRLNYPANHIEADNRLSWFLGRLDQKYGDHAFYVHLSREREATAASFAHRSEFGILHAYREGILLELEGAPAAHDIALDYLATVETNIACFLKDKSNKMAFRLEEAQTDFSEFWQRIGAEGNLPAALAEWQTRHNASA